MSALCYVCCNPHQTICQRFQIIAEEPLEEGVKKDVLCSAIVCGCLMGGGAGQAPGMARPILACVCTNLAASVLTRVAAKVLCEAPEQHRDM